MNVDLSAQLQRVEWALKIRSDLAASIQDWVVRQPWTVSARIADDRLSYSAELSILQKPPVDQWGFIFADSVHNLRAALDNAVTEIARATGTTDATSSAVGRVCVCPSPWAESVVREIDHVDY